MEPSSPSRPQDPPRPSPDSTSAASTLGDPHVGTRLGKYRILGRLGQGGMGVVYKAEDSVLRREVAIKVVANSVDGDGTEESRFLREARAAARLHHPNVVTIHDAGCEGEVQYFVMELVQGKSAQATIDSRGAIPWAEATQVLEQVCRGLAAAHEAGLVHRDIKPANIMLCSDGTAKLADFGLVRTADASGASLTRSGGVLGTPHFMSPEQCRGEKADERSDIYSLGATYYSLLCGGPPYPSSMPLTVMFAQCSNPVPDPRSVVPSLPEACAAIVRRAMAKEPFDRYPSATTMRADALRALEGSAAARREASVLPTVITGEAVGGASAPAGAAVPAGRRAAWGAAALAALALIGAIVHWIGRPGPEAHPSANGKSDAGAPPATGAWEKQVFAQGVDIRMRGKASATAFSRDGKRFATGTFDGDLAGVRVWDFETGREEPSLWPDMAVNCVAFSPKGDLVAASGGGDVRVHDLVSGRDVTVPAGGAEAKVYSIVFSSDGRTLAVGLEPEEGKAPICVRLADVATGESRVLAGQASWVWSVAISADGRRLASGARDGVVKTWELPSGEPREELSTGLQVNRICFSPADGTLAVCGGPTIQIWDLSTSKRIREWSDPGGEVWCVAFSPDGAVLASGGTDVTFWDPGRGVRIGGLAGHGDAVGGVAYSPDGRVVATACWDGIVRLRQVPEGLADRPGGGR